MRQDDGTKPRLADIEPLAFLFGAVVVVLSIIGVLVIATRDAGPSYVASGHHMSPSHVRPQAVRGRLDVAVGDYWFKPSTRRLRAGRYTFTTHNYGVVQHDVMIERVPIKFESPGAPVDEAAPFGIDGLKPGMTNSTTAMLTAGRWEIFCSVAGHYRSGQHQTITVYGRMPQRMRARTASPMGM